MLIKREDPAVKSRWIFFTALAFGECSELVPAS
jgi:hypothetical protein